MLVAGGATCLEQAEILSRIASDCGADASSVKCASSELSSGTPLFAGDSCSKAAEAVNRLVGEYVSVAHGDASRATAVCNLAGYIKVKGACAPFADILNDVVRDVQNGVLNNKCDITTQTTTATTSETTSASTTVTSTAYKEGIECTEVAGSALLIGGSGSTCVRVSKDLSAMASECGHGDVVIKCKDTAVGPVLLDAEACAETMKALNTLLDGYSTGQTIGTLTCELGGYLKDDVDCPSTVAVLTDALAAYHGGIFTNCVRSTATTTVSSTASSSATTTQSRTATNTDTSTATTSGSSSATSTASSSPTTSASTTGTSSASTTASTSASATATNSASSTATASITTTVTSTASSMQCCLE